tara:strand:- start:15 stop:620 length:606 start_codon:yes stop_codon:yes gene_type:complete
MAESVLIGAALGGGSAMLTGNDPLKGAALGGAMGGATAGFGGAGVDSAVSTTNPALVSAGSTVPTSTVAAGATTNPALTNSIGQSSNALTQFGRDASKMATDAYDTVGDSIGQGFDYLNDKTGMENKDWTQMAMTQGMNSMQPDPQQPIQAAPMGAGISRPQVDLSKSSGSLLSSNPMTSGAGGQQLTLEELKMLQQKGLL